MIKCKPLECRKCGQDLQGDDPEPIRHQVAEVPPICPVVDEYQLHRLICPDCGTSTCAALPPGVPKGAFGPRLQAILSVLAGAYRLSKRPIRDLVSDLLGLSISIGMISRLERQGAVELETPVEEIREHVRAAASANIDETSWWQGRVRAWLWVAVTTTATAFTRGGEAAEVGRRLLVHSDRLFEWWHRVRDGTMTRSTFRSYVAIMRFAVRDDLQQGAECPCSKTAATCRELQAGETHLWTFVRVEGIEPTNNEAERSLRHAVLYRKTSGGTDSESGSRFVERILTVVATCRQQKLNVLEYQTRCYQAHLDGQPAPSLLPASSIADQAA